MFSRHLIGREPVGPGKDSLRSARITMFAVGVLTIGANLFFGLYAAQMVDKEIEGMRKTGVVINEAELKPLRETAIRATQLSSFVFVGLGAIFIALGCFVYKAPVACTVTALVLYLGGWMATVAISVAGEDGAAFTVTIHAKLPKTQILFLAIKPSVSRWKLYDVQTQANAFVKQACTKNPLLKYIDTIPATLGRDGTPDPELLQKDGLHLSEKGYAKWNDLVRTALKDS